MKSKLLLIFVSAFALSFIPQLALAGGAPSEFSWLVGIPGISGRENVGFNEYINALYALAISLAALIAVVKIVIAGAKYMMDDIVTHKSEAKQDIWNALLGLLIIIGAVIILNTINTDLTNVQVDATPATVNDDPGQFFNRQAALIEDAISRNTPWVESTCPGGYGIASEFGLSRSCQSECAGIPGQFSWGVVYHTCSYAQDVADQCNPQATVLCCETIKGGDWDWDENSCSGMISEEIRIAECYDDHQTWDAAYNTCRTTRCNRQTDLRCCESYNGTYANGSCSIDTYNEEQDDGNGTQDYQASQCVVVDGGLWNYTSGECDERDEQYGYDIIPNQQFVDPNYNPQDRCDSLEEQMGIEVEYVANIRSCRWSN
jgi:hypothetical protein